MAGSVIRGRRVEPKCVDSCTDRIRVPLRVRRVEVNADLDVVDGIRWALAESVPVIGGNISAYGSPCITSRLYFIFYSGAILAQRVASGIDNTGRNREVGSAIRLHEQRI